MAKPSGMSSAALTSSLPGRGKPTSRLSSPGNMDHVQRQARGNQAEGAAIPGGVSASHRRHTMLPVPLESMSRKHYDLNA